MVKELKTVDDRLNWLAEELLLLKEEVAAQACRLETLERGKVVATVEVSRSPQAAMPAVAVAADSIPHSLEVEEDSWTHLGQAVLLPRVAAVSFMLVIALILRTVTDNGMLGLFSGSLLGMAYAIALIGAGVVLYARKSTLAPVFPTCGVLLLYSIIFETQNHFSSLSGQAGYLLLLAAEIATVLVGLHCRDKVLLALAVFASTAVGVAIGFPNLMFAMLGLVLLVNSIAAHFASIRQITHSLRWYSLAFAMLFWMLWAYKLNFALQFTPAAVKGMELNLFLPLLFLFWAFYTYTSLWQTLRSGAAIGVFHHLLPSVVAGGSFFAANGVLSHWVGQQTLVGGITVLASALYLGVVTWLARRGEEDIPGGKEFVTAATILLIQGLSILVPPLWALPVWTGAAAILTIRADHWRSGGIRLISYLFQLFVLLFALRQEVLSVQETAWYLGFVVAGGMAACNLWMYRWCRKHRPDYDSAFFTVFDRKDYSAVILLLLGLIQAFVAVSFMMYPILSGIGIEATKTFACAQSVILNSGIVCLLLLGLKRKNRELLGVAGVIVLVSALKVFLFDLFRANGLPLVFSVFSFGIVAATSSVVMRKWQGVKAEQGLRAR
ncbi:MAG: hypothetical protein PHI06_04925 [Desulfobulbaceae bacterium]|nr:hypothetical protein [Desulfobulbaceae bacterium]